MFCVETENTANKAGNELSPRDEKSVDRNQLPPDVSWGAFGDVHRDRGRRKPCQDEENVRKKAVECNHLKVAFKI